MVTTVRLVNILICFCFSRQVKATDTSRRNLRKR